MILINLFIKSQTIEEKRENAAYFKNGDFIYIYNMQNNKTINIIKYDLGLKVVKSFTKNYEKKVCKSDGNNLYSITLFDSTINIKVQFAKWKHSCGLNTILDFNLNELKTDEWAEPYQVTGWKYIWGEVPATSSYNPINESVYEKDVKNKLAISEVGPLLSFYNDRDSSSFQVANYGVTNGKKKYAGFYLLKYMNKNDKVAYLNKYPFFDFKEAQDDYGTYMEFYPDYVVREGQNYLIPFAQKISEVTRHTWVSKNGHKEVTFSGKYQIAGVGVLEVNSGDMSLKIFKYDRGKIKKTLRYEFVSGFKGKDINNFSILTKNFPSVDDKLGLKPNQQYIYTKDGEKLDDSGKHLQILLLDSKSYIKFDFDKSSYKMTKVFL
jgi:hypothetical protein